MAHHSTPVVSQFPLVESQLNRSAASYKTNRLAWTDVLHNFSASLAEASSEGDHVAVDKHVSRGQVLGLLCPEVLYPYAAVVADCGDVARDRVALLLDENSPFLELCAFAGHQLADSTPSASLVCGIGLVRFVPASDQYESGDS